MTRERHDDGMACTINDVQWRLGGYVDRTLPATLGREAASLIEAVGSGVTTLQVGQPIMARAPSS
jgi:NADPH:quinone reductase-like Zn-dependent oxidoreductase